MDYGIISDTAGTAILAVGLAAALLYFLVADRRAERKCDEQQRDDDEGEFGS